MDVASIKITLDTLGFTAGWQRAVSTAQTGSNSVMQSVQRIQNRFTTATSSVSQLNVQLDALRRKRDISVDTRHIKNLNREIADTERRMQHLQGMGAKGSGGGGVFGGVMAGTLAAGVVSSIAATAKTVALDSINAAMQFGMRTKSFEVLTGSATHGRELADKLRYMKLNTLVGGGVYQNAQTMMGFGIGENSVVKKLREVGDVGMGDTERMASLTLARSQTFAAGRLMGQDLLQYINAGFNPLSVMAEKWQDFGFKAKQTIGTLKDMMEQGKISSGMVDKAFEVATGKGGKFYNMMEQIGQTPGGKLLKMKGAWAAEQIDIGNALMPIANSALEAAGDLLHFVNISKTVPETLLSEKLEINSLVGSITKLNQGNEMRAKMIDMVKAKFPDMFSNIDREKTKNGELLETLNKVNSAYEKRINLSQYKLLSDNYKHETSELYELALKAQAHVSGVRLYGKNAPSMLDQWDRVKIATSGIAPVSLKNLDDTTYLNSFVASAMKKIPNLQSKQTLADDNISRMEHIDLLNEARALIDNPKGQRELWGKNYAKNMPLWNKEVANWKGMFSANNGMFSGSFLNYDYGKLSALVHPGGSGGNGGSGALSSVASEATDSIIGGGKKTININFYKEVIGKQEFKVGSMREATEITLSEFENQLLMKLQSVKDAL